jgi:hypothetical protein
VQRRADLTLQTKTSMIGLCQEGKSSPDALRRSAVVNSPWFFAASVGFSAVGSLSDRTRLPFAVSDQRVVLNRRLSLCFPASLETYRRGHPEPVLLRPVGLTARPCRRRAEEILLVHRHVLRSDAVTCFHHLKISLPTVDDPMRTIGNNRVDRVQPDGYDPACR